MFKRLLLLFLGSALAASAQTVINCASGFNTTTTANGACGISVNNQSADYGILNHPTTILSGTSAIIAPAGAGHQTNALTKQTPINVQAFTTTFTFVPNGYNLAFVLENNTYQFGGSPSTYNSYVFQGGAGVEGGFSQFAGGSNVANDHTFAILLDSKQSVDQSGTFTYSNIQLYQTLQTTWRQMCCGGTYLAEYATNTLSTSPVPLNFPATTASTSTGDTYSATVTYDHGTGNLTYSMFDVTAGGSCPGASCYTHTWSGVWIPEIVGANTAYVNFTAGTAAPATTNNLLLNTFVYTVNTPSANSYSYTPWNANSTYNIGTVSSASPVYSVAPGTYSGTQTVGISTSSSPSNYICYVLSATTPSLYPQPDNNGGCAAGTLYSGPVSIPSTSTLYAMAGSNNSAFAVASQEPAGLGPPSTLVAGTYTIGAVTATPTFSPAAGTYTSAQSVVISDTTSGAVIHYTLDGSTPTSSSPTYSAAIPLSTTTTVNAIAIAGSSTSSVATATYTINIPQVATPVFSLATGAYSSSQTTTITDATSGAAISWCYTVSGQTSCAPGTSYSSGSTIYVGASEVLCSYATAPGYTQSATNCVPYTLNAMALPVKYSPAPGTYSAGTTVTLSTDTTLPASTTANHVVRTQIYYTTDGSACDYTANPYTGPLTLSASMTLKACAGIIGTEQLGSTSSTNYWKAPDYANGGASGVPTSLSNPTGPAGTGNGQNGLLPTGGPTGGVALSFYMTPQASKQTNVLWAKSSSIPNSRCDHCTYMLASHDIKYGTNANLASKFENDNYNWDYGDELNFQGSSQLCYGSTCGGTANADVDVGGNASAHWTHTGLHPATTYGVWHHIVKMEHWVLAELTTKPCAAQSGTSNAGTNWPCIYFDKFNVDGTVGNLLASGMCGQSNGCVLAAEQLDPKFTVGYATDQYQTDSYTSSPASIQQIVANANFTALYDPSQSNSAAYVVGTTTPTAAFPVFSPIAGTYTGTQSVAISTTTPSSVICYTTDNSVPTATTAGTCSHGTTYASAITVATSETLNAITTAVGYTNSSMSTAAYTISLSPAATPTFTPPSGIYLTPQTVTIASATSGATIYYTLDGSTPTTASTVYSAPILVNSNENINAIATASGYATSAVGTSGYTIINCMVVQAAPGTLSLGGKWTINCSSHP